ncbi:MAG: hypothetical protein WAV28_02735 [Sedimentisphaerales bacterium]
MMIWDWFATPFVQPLEPGVPMGIAGFVQRRKVSLPQLVPARLPACGSAHQFHVLHGLVQRVGDEHRSAGAVLQTAQSPGKAGKSDVGQFLHGLYYSRPGYSPCGTGDKTYQAVSTFEICIGCAYRCAVMLCTRELHQAIIAGKTNIVIKAEAMK